MLKFAMENAIQFIPDAKPLLQEAWDEIGLAGKHTIDLDPNYAMYYQLSYQGFMIAATVRDEGKLVGFLVVMADNHLHHKDKWMANADVIYLHNEYRKGTTAAQLISFAEKELASLGVSHLMMQVTPKKDYAKLLTHRGFDVAETIYIKELGD